MSILSTMFITTALAGSLCVGTLPENCDILQSGKFGNVGYIIGGTSTNCGDQLLELLDKLGISKEDLNNCIKPSLPNKPETNVPNMPDTNLPENNTPELSLAKQVVALVNEERAAVGLNPLIINESAMSAAAVRSKEIRQSFSHTRPDGSSFSTALKEQGISYRGSGENIAYGQRSPKEVMKAWMNSSGHRANILNEKFTSIGVGCYEANGVLYWTQLFIY